MDDLNPTIIGSDFYQARLSYSKLCKLQNNSLFDINYSKLVLLTMF